jgi:hypothetical protein
VAALLLHLLSHMDPSWWWTQLQNRVLPVFISSAYEELREAAAAITRAGTGCAESSGPAADPAKLAGALAQLRCDAAGIKDQAGSP